MSNIISVVDKKDFLKSFLQHYELKRRECAWLLNYLMNDDKLMERVHFVEKAELTPKALIISTKGVDSIPFSFHKQQHVTTDAEKAFHDIRLNPEEEIYIEFRFIGAKQYSPYLAVLEDNPFLPENRELAEMFRRETEELIATSLRQFRRTRILAEIDHALDQGDKDLFERLVNELQKVDE